MVVYVGSSVSWTELPFKLRMFTALINSSLADYISVRRLDQAVEVVKRELIEHCFEGLKTGLWGLMTLEFGMGRYGL